MYFYRPARRFVAAVAVLLFPVAMIGYTGVVHGGYTGAFVVALVVAVFVFCVRCLRRRLRRPFLVIEPDAVACETVLGREHRIAPRECKLVLSNDWLGFRRGEANDVALGKAEFRPGEWDRAIGALRGLPFDGVVVGPEEDPD